MSNADSVVWILGAGFSKPLGGPLLTDFFGPRLFGQLQARLMGHAGWDRFNVDLNRLQWLCHGGRQAYQECGPIRGAPWQNAEEFLEYVELAADGGVAETALRARAKQSSVQLDSIGDIERLARVAKRYLAMTCGEFTEGADVKSERWIPYRMWANALDDEKDAIITFNYDSVCEMSIDPMDPMSLPLHNDRAGPVGSDRFLKMHGSADWCEESDVKTGKSSVHRWINRFVNVG